MQYVSCYGAIWKLSDRAWARYLRKIKAGEDADLNDFGKLHINGFHNVTDIDAEQANWWLEDFENNKKKGKK